jgi:hypothetical protein
LPQSNSEKRKVTISRVRFRLMELLKAEKRKHEALKEEGCPDIEGSQYLIAEISSSSQPVIFCMWLHNVIVQ